MTRPPGRPRSTQSRSRILAATRDLLAEAGVERLTMDAIAARAEVGKQTLYRWWPSKSAVVAEAVLEGFEPPAPTTTVQTGDLDADVTAWIDRSVVALSEPETATLLRAALAAIATDRPAGERYAELTLGPARRAVAELLVADSPGRAIGDASAEAIAELAISALMYQVHLGRGLDASRRDALRAMVIGALAHRDAEASPSGA